mgnify:FL=1
MNVDFSYYNPINKEQEQFHTTEARHTLLVGGFGAGKTYPSIHEAYRHCYSNPGHNYLVCRNTWDTLRDEVMQDFIDIGTAAGAIKKLEKSHDNIILHNDCKIMFRPLTLGRKDFKGMHLCGFYIDDPNVARFSDDISFLWSRLRNPPNVKATKFKSIITANWEGRNWLYQTYMHGREPGEVKDDIAYWVLSSENNPELPDTFISDMAAIHSDEWMDRFVYMKNMEANIGLIYHSFDPKVHNLSRNQIDELLEKNCVSKIVTVDVGGNHATAIYDMATDGRNIYIYNESYHKGWGITELGSHLVDRLKKDNYNKVIIDPSSAKGEMTSDRENLKGLLKKRYGVSTKGANNEVFYGITLVQDLLSPKNGLPRIYVDCAGCPNWVKEAGTYRWKEPADIDLDNLNYKDEPVKKNDDAMDSTRYGAVFLNKYIDRGFNNKYDGLSSRQARWLERATKLRYYEDKPEKVDEIINKFDLKETYDRLGFSKSKTKHLLSKGNSKVGRYERLRKKFKRGASL